MRSGCLGTLTPSREPTGGRGRVLVGRVWLSQLGWATWPGDDAKATTLTMAAGSHLTPRQEPGGGPHCEGRRHTFDDISGCLTPHFCLALLAVSLIYSFTLTHTRQSYSLDSLAQHTFLMICSSYKPAHS
jgi:hypothetical protein